MSTGLDIRPMAGALGAEVLGVDLTNATPAELDEIGRAFIEHQVLVFRSQFLAPDSYARVARHFGEPVEYPFAKGIEGFPEITVIAKEPHQTSNFGGMWHSDTTYKAEPPSATMLYCIETPKAGGDTIFACQYRAFETLSPGVQTLLSNLNGVSSSAKNASALRTAHLTSGSMQGTGKDDTMTATHPAVRVHPETRRRALYVNRSHTTQFEGWTAQESEGLLEHLFQHQISPELTARVRWAPGTLVIWDNRSSQHCAINDYDGHRREMWRITLAGDAPKGP